MIPSFLHVGRQALVAIASTIAILAGDSLVADSPILDSLSVHPERVELIGARATTQLVVTGHFRDGTLQDLTHRSKVEVPSQVTLDKGLIRAKEDGTGAILIRFGEHSRSVPCTVSQTNIPDAVSFRLETLAALTKQGCNSGSCHGKPNGRGALELSLNAFDPMADARTLIRAPLLRFTHPIEPTKSLLLRKPLLELPHGGGKRLRPKEEAYDILLQWIAEGCRDDTNDSPVCTSVEVFPPSGRSLCFQNGPEALPPVQQFRVIARFSDGSSRDVTRIASFQVTHDRIAKVDPHGLVTGIDRGQTAVVVRYLDHIASTSLTFIRDIEGFVWNQPKESHWIDTLVHRKLKELQYLPSSPCEDSTFLRRMSLDVRGLLPTIEETKEFLADPSLEKRARWIDRFLASEDHARYWGLRLADLLRINRELLSEEKAIQYSEWVQDSIRKNQPYDAFVRDLLMSTGDTENLPSANFYRVTGDTNMVTENVAQVFMGSRIQCAQCHNHPYESWTQDNYYQIGAAFHEVERTLIKSEETAEKPRNRRRNRKEADAKSAGMKIELVSGKTLSNPRTGQIQKPWPTDVPRSEQEDKRIAFVDWLTAKGNPFFAKVEVNRLWATLMGRGIVEPIDDFRSSNPAVNVELLERLAQEFEESGFDRRHVLRLILNSQTYQRSSEPNSSNQADEILFSHARTRMLAAEAMQDAIRRVCDSSERLEELKEIFAQADKELTKVKEQRRAFENENPNENEKESPSENDSAIDEALQRWNKARKSVLEYWMTQQAYPHLTPFLKSFGQPARQTVCACERREDVSLEQAIQLMNSDILRDYVQEGAKKFSRSPNDLLLSELYLAAFCREPNATEKERLYEYLASSDDRVRAVEDILWSLINTNEFMFQH